MECYAKRYQVTNDYQRRNPNPSDDRAQNTGVPSLRMKAVNKAKMIRAYLKITSTLTVNLSWGTTQMIKLAVHTAKDDDN